MCLFAGAQTLANVSGSSLPVLMSEMEKLVGHLQHQPGQMIKMEVDEAFHVPEDSSTAGTIVDLDYDNILDFLDATQNENDLINISSWNSEMYAQGLPMDFMANDLTGAEVEHCMANSTPSSSCPSSSSALSTASSSSSNGSVFEFPDYHSPEGSALLESEWLQQQTSLLSAH